MHGPYGGVVPELASRQHVRNLLPVVDAALTRAGIGLDQVGGIAVTRGPGLVGSLLVGVSFAKALAASLDRPIVAVHHLVGHILFRKNQFAEARKALEAGLQVAPENADLPGCCVRQGRAARTPSSPETSLLLFDPPGVLTLLWVCRYRLFFRKVCYFL